MENLLKRVDYERLQSGGPRLGAIGKDSPIVSPYFTRVAPTDENKHLPDGALKLANNGWIWNADPLSDFAGPQSRAYYLRTVIPWGDCVKLRYGQSRQDSPWLWDHMCEYTCQMAALFDGFRIDNCHSTPLHVAQWLLDRARQVNTNLYVVAELFTGNEDTDIKFVSRLGINSLIREAMQAWEPRELSRLVHRYGG